MELKKLQIIIILLFLSISSLTAQNNTVGKFLGSKDTTMPSWFLNSFLDLSEDVEEQAKQNKRLIVFVHQPNCPYCHRFVTKNLENKDIKNKIQQNFAIIDINMFGDREVTDIDGESYSEKDFAKKYNIQFTPTLIFFNEKGKQILRLNGYMPIEKFDIALDYVKDKNEKSITYKEYVEQKSNKKMNKTLTQTPELFMKSSKILRRDLNNKPLAIFFESNTCRECKKLHNLFLNDKVIKNLLTKIDIAQVDINSEKTMVTPNKIITKTKDWVKTLNTTYNPSIIFFDTKGKEIIRIESNFKIFHLQSIVDYVASGAYKTEPEFQRYLTKRSNAIRAKGIDVNIWETESK